MKRTIHPYFPRTFAFVLLWSLLAAGMMGVVGCGSGEEPSDFNAPSSSRLESAPSSYIETGDLPALAQRGSLRILMPPRSDLHHLPREGFPLTFEEELIHIFADSLNLTPVHVTVQDHKDLIPWLLEGKGDVVAANFTATLERKTKVAFTVPVAIVREQLVTRADETTLTDQTDLRGRTIVVQRSSSFWDTAFQLQHWHPGLKIDPAPENLDSLEILHKVAEGIFDLTIGDNNTLKAFLSYEPTVRAAFEITGDQPVAWALRPNSAELLKAANRFLNEAKLAQHRPAVFTDDLPALKRQGVIRVLTRNNPATYFIWKGKLLGFEYELARRFGKQHKIRTEMVVPPSRDDLITWLAFVN